MGLPESRAADVRFAACPANSNSKPPAIPRGVGRAYGSDRFVHLPFAITRKIAKCFARNASRIYSKKTFLAWKIHLEGCNVFEPFIALDTEDAQLELSPPIAMGAATQASLLR